MSTMFADLIAYCGAQSVNGFLAMAADLGIAAAYFTLPVIMIVVLWSRKRDLIYPSIWVLFVLFILACGLTHLVHAIQMPRTTFEHTTIEVVTKLVCLVLSVATAIGFALILPRIRDMPSPAEQTANLERLVAERTRQKDLLLQELSHRVGNQLQIINSLFNIERRRNEITPDQIVLLDRITKPFNELIDAHIERTRSDFNLQNGTNYIETCRYVF